MLLDDHPLVRKGLISILNAGGQKEEICEAGTVKKAIDMVATKDIDVALVDLSLSGESGFDFIEGADQMNKRPRVIVITSSTNLWDYERAKHLSVDGYMIKDAYVEDILYALRVVRRGEHFVSSSMLKRVSEQDESSSLEQLTKRETEVFQLLREGKSNAQISETLYISEATTKKHVSNILSKLNLKRRIEATLYAGI